MTDTTDKKADAKAAAAVAKGPDLSPRDVPPRTTIPDSFPGFTALSAAGIVTFAQLDTYAPEYRITGIDAATAKAIAEEVHKPLPKGVPAHFCTTLDTVVSALAVFTKGDAKAGTSDQWDVYTEDGGLYSKVREVTGTPTVPGEFSVDLPPAA